VVLLVFNFDLVSQLLDAVAFPHKFAVLRRRLIRACHVHLDVVWVDCVLEILRLLIVLFAAGPSQNFSVFLFLRLVAFPVVLNNLDDVSLCQSLEPRDVAGNCQNLTQFRLLEVILLLTDRQLPLPRADL